MHWFCFIQFTNLKFVESVRFCSQWHQLLRAAALNFLPVYGLLWSTDHCFLLLLSFQSVLLCPFWFLQSAFHGKYQSDKKDTTECGNLLGFLTLTTSNTRVTWFFISNELILDGPLKGWHFERQVFLTK